MNRASSKELCLPLLWGVFCHWNLRLFWFIFRLLWLFPESETKSDAYPDKQHDQNNRRYEVQRQLFFRSSHKVCRQTIVNHLVDLPIFCALSDGFWASSPIAPTIWLQYFNSGNLCFFLFPIRTIRTLECEKHFDSPLFVHRYCATVPRPLNLPFHCFAGHINSRLFQHFPVPADDINTLPRYLIA